MSACEHYASECSSERPAGVAMTMPHVAGCCAQALKAELARLKEVADALLAKTIAEWEAKLAKIAAQRGEQADETRAANAAERKVALFGASGWSVCETHHAGLS